MTRSKLVCLMILLAFSFFVCKKEAVPITIIPVKSEINTDAGEKVILSIKVIDLERKIAKISGLARDYPEYKFELNDNGEFGDLNAKDDVWSKELEIPYNAPPGKYILDCESYDSAGNPIMEKSETGEETKITVTIVVSVK